MTDPGSGADPFQWDFVTPGLPDALFEDAPGFSPTPLELRVMLLVHLRPRADSLVWDVGGGTGALALEIARLLPAGMVHTLERDPEAIELLERNRQRFGIHNLHIHAGRAPDDLATLPPHPDRVLLEVGRPLGDMLRVVWEALRDGTVPLRAGAHTHRCRPVSAVPAVPSRSVLHGGLS